MARHFPLGRREPKDFVHVDKYPLTASTLPPPPTPVAIGVNWYPEFDEPVRRSDGTYWIRAPRAGSVPRGGHCVCLKPDGVDDPLAWWDFYNQGTEGACVGFGSSRMMSLLNRKRYHPRWLWNEAKKIDEWPDTNPGDNNGTSVRAACDVLRIQGHWPTTTTGPRLVEGIAANRWATSVDEIRAVLSSPRHDKLQAFPFLNSWGRAYPHITYMPYTVMARLLSEYGEACVITDR